MLQPLEMFSQASDMVWNRVISVKGSLCNDECKQLSSRHVLT